MSFEEREGVAVDERELREALAGLRPEPEEFRAGVDRRVEAGRARREEQAREAARSPFVRAAAGVLPAGLLRTEVALSASVGFLWKLLALVFVMPATLLTMTFFGSWLAAASWGGPHDVPSRAQEQALARWWRAHALEAGIVGVLLAVLLWTEPALAALALLLASSGLLLAALTRLRAAGFDSRARIARNAGFLLVHVLWFLVFLESSPFSRSLDLPYANAVYFLLCLGTVACLAVFLAARFASPWQALVRSSGLEAYLLLTAVLLAPIAVVLGINAVRSVRFDSPAERAASALAALDTSQAWLPWRDASRVLAWVRARGVEPEVSALRARWQAEFESRPHAELLFAGLGSGWATPEEVERRLPVQVRSLLGGNGPFARGTLAAPALGIQILLRTGITSEQREALRQRLVESFPTESAPGALEHAAWLLALLEELEPGASAPLAPDARKLLSDSWSKHGWPGRHGFGEGALSWPPHARYAVEIMRWSGVPEEVDLELVAQELARAAKPVFPWNREGWLQLPALMALDLLRTEIAPVPWARKLLDASFLAAVSLLVVLSVHASLRAPLTPD